MSSSALNVVVLAAGKGKRMNSDLPKVLHPLAGKPLLGHVLDTAGQLDPARLIVVIGHGAQAVQTMFLQHPRPLAWAEQTQQLGTGHAVAQAAGQLDPGGPTLILYGDVPLTRLETLQALINAAGTSALGILTAVVSDPTGYGRIVREGNAITRIVEHKDASPEERAIAEINTGIMVVPTTFLQRALGLLRNENAQGEYYLTDLVGIAVAEGLPVVSASPEHEWETEGVNSKVQLATLERIHQHNLAQQLLESGVTLADPTRLDVRGQLRCGRDVIIDVGCVFEGTVALGDGVRVGPYAVLKDVTVGAGTVIHPYCHLDGAQIGADAVIGPFARLRPTTSLADGVHIGNFVEVKNAALGANSKANHLAYVGDATVGARVNVGAGTIVANYDGANKHRTVIEDDAHTGSNSVLVAPIVVGAGATIGAGSTVTRAVPAGKLTVARAKAVTLNGWTRPRKQAK